MAALANEMPQIKISQDELREWGRRWLSQINPETGKTKKLSAFDRQQSVNFASFIDRSFARSLAVMLGDISILTPNRNALIPEQEDCVEVGPVRIIGGIRPQNFDVAYRPDGPRIVFDSKSLNDKKSIAKNWQNMVNDLATEAATVHTRFPYAIVTFIVVLPQPALAEKQQLDIIRTLERLGNRQDVLDQAHLAESIALLIWNPKTGRLVEDIPNSESPLRIEKMPATIYRHYIDRYKGLPPHD